MLCFILYHPNLVNHPDPIQLRYIVKEVLLQKILVSSNLRRFVPESQHIKVKATCMRNPFKGTVANNSAHLNVSMGSQIETPGLGKGL